MTSQPLSVDQIQEVALEGAPYDFNKDFEAKAAVVEFRKQLAEHGYQIVHVGPGHRLQKVVDVEPAGEKSKAG